MGKIFVASRDAFAPQPYYQHTYLVYDADGNARTKSDQKIISLQKTETGTQVEADRPTDASSEKNTTGDQYSDLNYTTVHDGEDAALKWQEMVNIAKSLGVEQDDPVEPGQKIYVPEHTYNLDINDCHTLTNTVLSGSGKGGLLNNIPKVGGDEGSGEKFPANRFPGGDGIIATSQDDALDLTNTEQESVLDQGGSDTYVIDAGPGGRSNDDPMLTIVEDTDLGTADKIVLTNINPADLRYARIGDDLYIYFPGDERPDIRILGQFSDGARVPSIFAYPGDVGGTPTIVPLTNPNNFSNGAFDDAKPLPAWLVAPSNQYAQTPVTSPLVLDLDGDGVEVTQLGYGAGGSTTYFDMDNDGFAQRTAWVSGGDGLLALDRNSNGKVDDKSELFGDNAPYADGFAHLRSLDSNGSNTITSADAQWNNLRVWIDADEDGLTDTGELKTLAELGITAINLSAVAQTGLYRNDNLVSHTSTYTINGQTRAVEDVWFRSDAQDSIELDTPDLNVATLFLPTLKGFGTLSDLHVAMSRDAALLTLVKNFTLNWVPARLADPATLNSEIQNILFKWAGVDGVNPLSMGATVNMQYFRFMEKISGVPPRDELDMPGLYSSGSLVTQSFNAVFDAMKAQLIVQVGGSAFFNDTVMYDVVTGTLTSGAVTSAAVAGFTNQAAALANESLKTAYWTAVTEVLLQVKSKAEYSGAEASMLDSAIKYALPASSWDAISQSVIAKTASIYVPQYESSGYLTGTEAANTLTAYNMDSVVHGLGGNDTINGGNGHDFLYGNAGNDTIYGRIGNDVLSGGAGNDTVDGGDGDDIFIYESGVDTYLDVSAVDGNDTIKILDPAMTAANLTWSRAPTNQYELDLYLNGSLAIKLTNQFISRYGIETIQFADGSNFNLLALQYTSNGTSGNDTLYGINSGGNTDDSIDGKAGNDAVYGYSGNDLITGGVGNDNLNGGEGNDTYFFTAGDGSDFVIESSAQGMDTIRLVGLTASQVTVARAANGNILITNSVNSGDLITIYASSTLDAGGHIINDRIERIVFDNGTVLALHSPTEVYGSEGNDTITGTSISETLYGFKGNDTLNGGSGNDTLRGGLGNDTYIVDSSLSVGAEDTIYEEGGIDTIVIPTTIANVRLVAVPVSQYNSTLSIVLNGYGTINVTNHFISNTTAYSVDKLRFSDGSELNLWTSNLTYKGTDDAETIHAGQYGSTTHDTLLGLGGDDTLYGYSGNDTLNGGSGADSMSGGLGHDTYIVDNVGDYVIESDGQGADTVQSSISYTLAANVENLTLTGSSGAAATGNGLANILIGNSGNNTLNGDLGNDTLYGNAGSDTLNGGEGNDILYGGSSNDTLRGDAGNDTLNGNSGNDTLNGGIGNDTYVWGAGYAVDQISDFDGTNSLKIVGLTKNEIIINVANAGYSNQFTITSALSASDVIVLIKNAGVDSQIQTLEFDNGEVLLLSQWQTWQAPSSNLIEGDAGGVVTNDTLTGTAGVDTVRGFAGNDTLSGLGANDTLEGGIGNDSLDGGSGVDTMVGGAGDDIYIVDDAAEVVTELSNEGIDLVQSSVTYALAANIENLTLTGVSAINGTGNTLNNVIVGSSGNNTIEGGAGNDTLTGGDGVDTVSYAAATAAVTVNLSIATAQNTIGAGTDTTSGFENLRGSAYNDTLTGDANANVIEGGAGNDTIASGLGGDTMSGGTGDDTYSINETTDLITENLNEGIDTVQSSLTYTLAANIEKGLLTGSTGNGLTGNALDNELTGNGGINTLTGGDGADIIYGNGNTDYLWGGIGTDTLYGGSGNDVMHGEAGNDTLTGGTGNDDYYGEAGLDTLIADEGTDELWGGADADVFKFASTALDGSDYIRDYNASQNDVIDVKDLLFGYDPLTSLITNFVEMTTSGANTIMRIDRDGTGSSYTWAQAAQIDGVTGMTDEQALLNTGKLIAA